MGEYPLNIPKPKTVEEALEEIRMFNLKRSAKIIEKHISSQPKTISREQWVEVLKKEALSDPKHGWLSDLGKWDLEWSDLDESIVLGYHEGSIDIGHLVGIIQHVLENGIPDADS